MPLFEVDANRPLLVQSGRPPAVPGVSTTAHQVVESHIDRLLGEQIFPVAPGTGPDEPHLLALDATGAPVVVELVGDLDRAALTRALDHAGAAGRMARADLAVRYHGGPDTFQRDVDAFYDSVPVTRSRRGRGGARLIIICQEASAEVLNAVDFLRQSSMPVEVLTLGVVHSTDGRRFVDVSPLVVHPASPPGAPRLASGEPTGTAVPVLRRDEAGTAPEQRFRRSVPRPPDVEPERRAERAAVGLALSGTLPAVVQAPEQEPQHGPEHEPQPENQREPQREPQQEPQREPQQEPPQEHDGTVGQTAPPPRPVRRSRTDRFARPAEREAPRVPAPWEPRADTPLRVPPLEAPSYTPPPERRPAYDPLAQPSTYRSASADGDEDQDLAALAGRLGRPTPIVWSRPRRRQHFEAVLHTDGTIELAGGGRYRSPDAAAGAAAGTPTADGWGVWRIGPYGPTLLEAYRRHFS